MSPQLLWAIAGLIITVLTLGGVSISSYQSLDSAKSKLIASEVGNISTAAKLWMANNSTNNSFVGISSTAMTRNIPDLTEAAGSFTSKADADVSYTVDSAQNVTAGDSFTVTALVKSADKQSLLVANLTNKACTAALGVTTVGAETVTYTCKG